MIDKDKLGRLIVSRWTEIINPKSLLTAVLDHVKLSTFTIVRTEDFPERQSVQLSVIKAEIMPTGVKLWVDFFVPKSQGVADVGTIESLCGWDGSWAVLYCVGNRLTRASASA